MFAFSFRFNPTKYSQCIVFGTSLLRATLCLLHLLNKPLALRA